MDTNIELLAFQLIFIEDEYITDSILTLFPVVHLEKDTYFIILNYSLN